MEPDTLDSSGMKKPDENPSIFSNKDSLIRRLEKERDILGRKLKQTIERSKALHNQLAELDISTKIELTDLRNEVSALKREITDLSDDRSVLLKENEMLLTEITDREEKIEEVSRDREVKDLQFKEFRGDLLSAAERLRAWEEKYSALEEEYLSIISGAQMPEAGLQARDEAAAESEPLARVEALTKEVSELRAALEEKTAETATLRQYITHLNSAMVGKDKAAEDREREAEALKAAVAQQERSLEELDKTLAVNEALEQDIRKAREDLEGAFKHRANEVGAIRERYEAVIEKLNNDKLTLEAELETLKNAPASTGDSELAALLEKEKAKTAALIEALTQKDRTIEELGESVRELRDEVAYLAEEREGLKERLLEAEHLKEDNSVLAEKIREAELSLSRETALKKRAEKDLERMKDLHDKKTSELEAALEKQSGLLEAARLEKERFSERASVLDDSLQRERAGFAEAREAFEKALLQNGTKMDEMSESVAKLAAENESLSRSVEGITEELNEKSVWLSLEKEKLETTMSTQTRGLERKMDSLVQTMEERMRAYVVLLENISAEISDPKEEPVEPEEPEAFSAARQPRRPGRSKALAAMALVVLIAAGSFLYMTDRITLPQWPGKESPAEATPWAEGIKHALAGGVDITLTFLDRGSLGILALSEKVSDSDLATNHFALLEMKAAGGCISEEFDSAVASNVSFLTAGGSAVPAIVPPALADEGSSVYRAGACGEKTGVVSLRRYLSAPRQQGINGVNISGISEEAPLVNIR